MAAERQPPRGKLVAGLDGVAFNSVWSEGRTAPNGQREVSTPAGCTRHLCDGKVGQWKQTLQRHLQYPINRVRLHQLNRRTGLLGYGVLWNHSPEQPLTHAAVQHTVSIALLFDILHRARAAGPSVAL